MIRIPSLSRLAPALACALVFPSAWADAKPQGNTAPPIATIAAKEAIEPIRTLGTFTNRRQFRQLYLLVPKGLSEAQLAALAQSVHSKEKDAHLWLLDDDSEFAKALEALPRIEKGEPHTFPSEWFDKHVVARTTLVIFPGGGREWILLRGDSYDVQDHLATLPCYDGAGGCKPKSK